MIKLSAFVASVSFCAAASFAYAQDGAIVYKLGKDAVAVDTFSRTSSKFTGEIVTRSGAAVIRTQHDISVGANGRPTSAVLNIADLMITIRPTGPTVGAIDFVWGKGMATAKFTTPMSR